MKYRERIERARLFQKLIQEEATGNPEKFAGQLHLKKRQLYNIIEEFKSYGADIQYDRIKQTYYYASDFEIV
jgi:hypothetical protein